MSNLLHQLINDSAKKTPSKTAIVYKKTNLTYSQLEQQIDQQTQALLNINLSPQQRVGIYLPKQIETVNSFFSIAKAGGVFVPINPVLKAAQVTHILVDCNVQILITSKSRLISLHKQINNCPDLHTIVLVENNLPELTAEITAKVISWDHFLDYQNELPFPRIIDTHMAAILYTSGSTGKPKGVVLSHLNLVAGAQSVAEYLHITEQDKLLAVLPFSFDYGLNQLISAMLQGATCVLLDFLLPRDVIKNLEKHQITGLAAVPPLWAQLQNLQWPTTINNHLRFLTNSGGKMPKSILDKICGHVPNSQFYLMYGLTEAFRSTYLSPEKLEQYPDSIGKAIPNAEILVVKEDGSLCKPNEPGELVHKGSLVAMGYWNAPEKTAERFKPTPDQLKELPLTEIAVWSGDQVTMNEEGYLFFVGRKDDMLKTSGYRVSPTEIEEIFYNSDLVNEAAAIGIPHETLGQAIIVIVSITNINQFDETSLLNLCRSELANFMVPAKIIALEKLPKNPNGKIDRNLLTKQYKNILTPN